MNDGKKLKDIGIKLLCIYQYYNDMILVYKIRLMELNCNMQGTYALSSVYYSPMWKESSGSKIEKQISNKIIAFYKYNYNVNIIAVL